MNGGDTEPVATCRGCGRAIVWAINTRDGKPIPLNPSAPVFAVQEVAGVKHATQTGAGMFLVSHFATCSAANSFSGRNRGRPSDRRNKDPGKEGDLDG
jgi:hypothetical protein